MKTTIWNHITSGAAHAVNTFLQAFLAVFTASNLTNSSELHAAIGAAVVAGIAAVLSLAQHALDSANKPSGLVK